MKKAEFREVLVNVIRTYNERLREIAFERDFYQKQAQKNLVAFGIATIGFGISLTLNFVMLGIIK